MKAREFDFVGWRNLQLSRAGLVPERSEMFLTLSIHDPINDVLEPISGMVDRLDLALNRAALSRWPVISIRENTTEVLVVEYEAWKKDFTRWHTGTVFHWSATCYWPARETSEPRSPIEIPDESLAILEISGFNPDVMPDGSFDLEKGRARFGPSIPMVEVNFRVAHHHLENDAVESIADDLVEFLGAAPYSLGGCWGCVTIDRFERGTTPFERWYSTMGKWKRPKEHPRGYYWANLITTEHIERLGGVESVLERSATLGLSARLIQDDRTMEGSVIIRMSSPISRYTAEELRAVKELLDPSLLYPDGGYEYYLGPPLQIIPDDGTAFAPSVTDGVPELDDADFDLDEFFDSLTSNWGAKSIGHAPDDYPFLE